MESNGKQVSALDGRPYLQSVELFYCSAYQYLSPMSGESGIIPIGLYCDYHKVFGSPHSLRRFATIMQQIDIKCYVVEEPGN